MFFKLLLVSDEVENFQREISIDADATFLDLNNAILEACDYSSDQITSFYTCDENWQQQEQIIREKMDDEASTDEDIYFMEDTSLRDMLEDIDDHLVYVFDPLSERMFFMKVTDMITGKNLDKPVCSKSVGKAPEQIIDYDASLKGLDLNSQIMDDDDQDFYGSEGFNEDEFDEEAFEIEDM